MIAIVDLGMGNLGSIFNMFKKIGVSSIITSDPKQIEISDKLILPGVGHFDRAMEKLDSTALRTVLDSKALQEKVPVLGICLGMQLMTRASEEGTLPGLGWVPANTSRFRIEPESRLKVPHMGWNDVFRSCESPLTLGFEAGFRFYFVHSYCVQVDDVKHSILKARHGVEFDAGIQKDNIFGVQFHPEKSHRFGMKLLENFARI
ncbi:MAG: imidazole glycerol phosphate synthase subunit HisH [Syntrophobacteraceae bacterium]